MRVGGAPKIERKRRGEGCDALKAPKSSISAGGGSSWRAQLSPRFIHFPLQCIPVGVDWKMLKTVNVFLKNPLFFFLSLSLSPRGPLLYVSAARCQDPILPHPAEAEVHSIKQQSVDLCGEIFPTLDFPVFPSPLQRQQARHVRARH